MSPIVIYPEYHMPPVPSLIASYGVCGVLPLALACFAALNWACDRLRARRARAAAESTAPAADGQTVVRGTVELAQGATHAIRVEIEQFGYEFRTKSDWYHEWKELERRMLVEPFYVREPNGRRIRVEATTDVYIIDELDEVIRTARDKRVRVATVSPGEEVYVFGVLGFGKDPEAASSYRDDGHGLVLRSPDAGHMLVATTSPAARFRASTRVHGLWVVIFVLLAGVFQIMNVMHSVRVAAGQTATATVLGTRTYTTERKKGVFSHHFMVKSRIPDGTVFEEEVEKADWAKLSEGAELAAVYVPGKRGFEILGDRPTVHLVAGLVPFFACVFFFLGYLGHRKAARPWYERATLNERGKGKLPDP